MLVTLFASLPFGHHLTALIEGLQRLRQTNRYRPERHYMRGPGPKWRARHQREQSGL